MELTRRNFVAGAAALGGSAALASATLTASQACANEAAALPEGTTAEDFANSLVPVEPIADFVDEKSYDVVVVGAGTAGVPAVWGALEEGATVACLQKEVAPMANGNGSSGLILEESNEIGKLQYKQNWRKAGGYRMKLHAGPGLLGGGKTDKEVKFILDEDLSANGSLSADSVPGKLEDLHRYAVRLFRGAITPELHNALGPTPPAE